MNTLEGTILDIVSEEAISLIRVGVGDHVLSSILIDTPATLPALRPDHPVRLLFKETEVIIAKPADRWPASTGDPTSIAGLSSHPQYPPASHTPPDSRGTMAVRLPLSIQNQLPCTILQIHTGKILCELTLRPAGDYPRESSLIRSLITRNACTQLGLQVNDNVIALIKTNEISILTHD